VALVSSGKRFLELCNKEAKLDIRLIRVMLIGSDSDDERQLRILLEDTDVVRFELVCVEQVSVDVGYPHQDEFDVILLVLPVISNQYLDMFTAVRIRVPQTPIIVLTDTDETSLTLEIIGRGAKDCLVRKHINNHFLTSSIFHAIERHRLESELRSREARFSKVITHSADGIIIVDNDGIVRFVNPAVEALFGRPAKDILDTMFGFPAVAGETEEIDILRRNQEQVVAEMRVVEIEWEGDKAYLASLRDITQRKQLEHSLRTSLAKERELGELKTRFVSMASHELRTPLAIIQATSDSLIHYLDRMDEEQRVNRCAKIRFQIAHMTALLDGVWTVGKLEAGAIEFKPELFDLDALFTEIVDEFRETETTHQIVYSYARDCIEIMADPKLMRQTITNLLSNALKYSPDGGMVNLKLACDERKVVLQVKDEGIGIPEKDQERLFEPFHRAANIGTIPGTGLGLTIAKHTVELHGGEITFESKTDLGTTFTITLPRST
jgi:signal transduction histidine kinase